MAWPDDGGGGAKAENFEAVEEVFIRVDATDEEEEAVGEVDETAKEMPFLTYMLRIH